MSPSSAYLLISHGSHDLRPQRAMAQLAQLLRIRLASEQAKARQTISPTILPTISPQGSSGDGDLLTANGLSSQPLGATRGEFNSPSKSAPLVGTATLELADLPLHQQIVRFAQLAKGAGCQELKLLPLFLLRGVHVMEDIPWQVSLAQQKLGSEMVIHLLPHLGANPALVRLLRNQWAKLDGDAKILLSHGTSRPGVQEETGAVANQLGAVAADWSVQPSLWEQVSIIANSGAKRIAILAYFLFEGRITDAIAQMLLEIQQKFPQVQLNLGKPIGVSEALVDLIMDGIRQQ
ncbi:MULTISPECIES: CbiX/SirB N-terminal domain-containing protein [unclassified Moorena]|uniref:sirohydrochlorin chelatase n=1 Tax=unclassified Moorena TaxID=2683338 RepID=UPI00257F577C|nr:MULTISPECIES: CbiX/SirB N-terminal domain-containing protein [unclassified Moorena]